MQKSTMATPPPPPPPASPPTSTPKINRKTMIALGVIVIIVVAIVAGVILATRGGGGSGGDVAGASSLQFSEDLTAGGVLTTYTYSAKNIGTANAMLRIEWTSSGADNIYIINGAQKQAWIYGDGVWTNYSDLYSDYWSVWNSTFTGITNSFASHWSGSNYTYTDPSTGDTVRIYNVSVNPSFPDSLFQHS